MKTKITYPERARKAKAILVAVLFSIQASIIASDSTEVNQKLNYANDVYIIGTEFSNSFDTGNAYDYLYEEAYEAEMEIEEWMYNVQNDYVNYNSDEDEMEIEEWMCNIHHSFWLDHTVAKESEPAIERWMTNPDEWFEKTTEILFTSK